MGKAFEKQTKTIEDQGKKQIDALADLKPKEIKPRETKANKYGDYFIDGLAKLRESYKPTDFKSIHNGDIPLEEIEKEQIELKSDLGRIKQGDPRDKSKE